MTSNNLTFSSDCSIRIVYTILLTFMVISYSVESFTSTDGIIMVMNSAPSHAVYLKGSVYRALYLQY